MHPQVLTITVWPIPPEEIGDGPKVAIMGMNSVNLKSSTLCYMGAFIAKALAQQFGLEEASKMIFQTALAMTMNSQFKAGPGGEEPYDPATDCGDSEPTWGNNGHTHNEDSDDDYGSGDFSGTYN